MERTSLHNDSLLYASLIAILLLISYWFTTRCFKIISGIEGMGLGMWGEGAMPPSLQAVWWGDLGTGCLRASLWAPRSPQVSLLSSLVLLCRESGDSRSSARFRGKNIPSISYSVSGVTGGVPQWRQRFGALGPSRAVLLPPAPWSSSDDHCVQGHADPRACVSPSTRATSACTGPVGSSCDAVICWQ